MKLPLPSDRALAAAAALTLAALWWRKRRFSAPCDSRRLRRDFGHWCHKNGNDCFHTGLDFKLPIGSEVRAAAPGIARVYPDNGRGFGLQVHIEHADGWVSRYAHLSKALVTNGQSVARADLIALSGRSGHTRRRPTLHFEIRGPGYLALDPWGFLRW